MARKLRKHLYEGMYIFNATLSDDAVKKALSRITSSIEEKDGEIHKVHDQGRKKLQYAIDGNRQGYYFLLYFSVPSLSINEMWKEYHLNEDLLRFMTLRTEKILEEVNFEPLPQ